MQSTNVIFFIFLILQFLLLFVCPGRLFLFYLSERYLIIQPIVGTEETAQARPQVRIPTCLAVNLAGESSLRFSVCQKIIGKTCCLHVSLLCFEYKGREQSFRIIHNPFYTEKKIEGSHNFLCYNI